MRVTFLQPFDCYAAGETRDVGPGLARALLEHRVVKVAALEVKPAAQPVLETKPAPRKTLSVKAK